MSPKQSSKPNSNKPSPKEIELTALLLSSIGLNRSNFIKLRPHLSPTSTITLLSNQCIRNDQTLGKNEISKIKFSNAQETSLEYQMLKLMLLIEMNCYTSNKSLRQKFIFINQVINKVKASVKKQAIQVLEAILQIAKDKKISEFTIISEFLIFLDNILTNYDAKKFHIYGPLEWFFITLIYLVRNIDSKGDQSILDQTEKIIEMSRSCLGSLYSHLSEKAYQNMFSLLGINISIIFELMTDRVRNIREFSCQELKEQLQTKYTVDLERANNPKFEGYLFGDDYIPLKSVDGLKFKYFEASILLDIIAVQREMLAKGRHCSRLRIGVLLHSTSSLTDTDVSDVSHDDEHLKILFEGLEETCALVEVACQRLSGFRLKLVSHFLIKAVNFKMYRRSGFLIRLLRLLISQSDFLPRDLHLDMLFGQTDLAFLLSKLLLWDIEQRKRLETDHAKMKKVTNVYIFDKKTLPWTEKLLQNENEQQLVHLRSLLLEYFEGITSNRGFRASLDTETIAKVHAYLQAEFIDKLRVFKDFSTREQQLIVSIVENIPTFIVRQESTQISQIELYQGSLNFFQAADILGLHCNHQKDRVQGSFDVLATRNSILSKRLVMNEYMEPFLKEYLQKRKKMLKLQEEDNTNGVLGEGQGEEGDEMEQEAAPKFAFASASLKQALNLQEPNQMTQEQETLIQEANKQKELHETKGAVITQQDKEDFKEATELPLTKEELEDEEMPELNL